MDKGVRMELLDNHITSYFKQVSDIAEAVNKEHILQLAQQIAEVRKHSGRLFFLGVGGSAANCSHAVNDFRKLCGIECYAPTDNVSELTARINDEGWDGALVAWLKGSKLNNRDAVFIMSVGGGNKEKQVSINLVNAIDYAEQCEAKILGIVGRDGGHTKVVGDAVVTIPNIDDKLVTPHTEAFQAVVWHCLVSHPLLQINSTKW